jgi:hypothetical protein
MSKFFPEQLKLFTEVSIASGPGGSKIRNYSFGNVVIIATPATPPGDYTVNTVLRFIEEVYNDYLTTIDYTKSENRFRPFQDDFGDTVVFPGGVAIGSDQSANELIEIMRVLYSIRGKRTATKTGFAKQVLN